MLAFKTLWTDRVIAVKEQRFLYNAVYNQVKRKDNNKDVIYPFCFW